MILKDNLRSLIENKSEVECSKTALLYASTYINQLNKYINGNINLTESEINNKVGCLAESLTITLDHPMQEMISLRVRLCEENNFTSVDELSYIKRTTSTFPCAGRLNLRGQAHTMHQ